MLFRSWGLRTLTILSEVPPMEMVVPLSPTREGSVWDIQLVTMAMVLRTAPIFSIGTLMSLSPGPRHGLALLPHPALPFPGTLRSQSPLCLPATDQRAREPGSQRASPSTVLSTGEEKQQEP